MPVVDTDSTSLALSGGKPPWPRTNDGEQTVFFPDGVPTRVDVSQTWLARCQPGVVGTRGHDNSAILAGGPRKPEGGSAKEDGWFNEGPASRKSWSALAIGLKWMPVEPVLWDIPGGIGATTVECSRNQSELASLTED